MPHLRFRGLNKQQVSLLSESLHQDLAKVIGTSEDNFTTEWIDSQFFKKGHPIDGDPFVEVLWFDRTDDIRDLAAATITQKIKALVPDKDVTVVFVTLQPVTYYENGKSF